MDDSTLDKLFSDGLAEEQEFDFREEDWDELEDRLEEKGKRRWIWVWWAAAACLVLSVGMNVWQAMSLNEIKGEISQMQEVLQEESKQNTLITADTTQINTTSNIKPPISNDATAATQKQQVIIKRDTIIQRVEVPVYVYPKAPNPVAQAPEEAPFIELAPQTPQEATPKSTDKLLAEEAQQFIDDQPAEQSRLDLLPSLPLAAFDHPVEEELLPLSGEFLEEYDEKEIWKATKQRRWQMGPTLAYKRIPDNRCVDQSNAGIGWQVDYRASPKWAVQGNYSYNSIHSTCLSGPRNNSPLAFVNDPNSTPDDVRELDNLFLSDIEANEVSNDADSLYQNGGIRNIRSRQSYLELSLGTKYFLPKAFYVKGSIAAYHSLVKENEYNADVSTNNSKRAEYALFANTDGNYDSRISKPGLIIDRLEIGFGKEFKLSQNWRIPVELYYQQNLNINEFSLPPLLGVRTGFLFSF